MQLKKGTQRGFVIISESAGDESGWSVSSAGDVNGDGLDDLIVGAKNAKVGKEYSAGKSYVVFGKQDNTNTIDLSDIAYGIGGFVINGESAGNQSGYSVSNAGDVNGDGLDDLIVGTNTAKTGKSYVVFGKQDTDPIELSAITAGKGGFIINDESGRNFSGCLVSSAGDVNGDGLDDLIISAIYSGDQDNRFKPGKSYVVFGKKDNTAINLSDIAAGIGGFVINGESVSVSDDLYVMGRGMPAGHSVSSAGDVNGDGLDDLIVGARAADPSNKLNAGKSYVVFGKKDNTNAIELSDIVAGTGGFVINGELAYDKSGWSVSSAGDVNGDGLDDLIVGAYTADTGGSIYAIKKYNVGKSYVVFGKKDTYSIELSDISSGIGGFVIIGELADDKSGWSVSSAGDVNGDGLDDLIVGAYQATPRDKSSTGTPQIWGPDSSSKSKAGKSYVVFGKKDNTNAIELSDIAAGIGGFVIIGESVGDYSGCSVSNAGDVNGDGLDDLIVGAYDAKLSAGKSYVIFGKTDTGAIDLSKLGDKSKYTIDYLGDKNDNILTGTTKDEIFVAGAGNDTLTGNGGMDVLNAGTGDDTIIINASNIAALEKTGAGNRARVDGGGGTDTLKLEGAGLTLDLTKISDRRIQDIEVIDITGSGNNTLKFNLDDLLHTSTSANILKVLGNSGDEVVTTGFNDLVTNKTVNGVAYNVYTYGDTNAELWIQERVTLRKMQCGFVVNGESKHDYSGWSVSSAGDVNGDGVDDLIVGAYGANLSDKIDAGKSYVIFGKQDNTAINLSAIVAGTGGFVINGESARGWSGWSVSNAGDVNADGLDDLIIGAGQSDLSGKSNAGKSYVVFGKKDNTHAVELSDIAAGTGGFVINGESAGDFSGHSVSNAGDVNGDGLDDLIVGAYQANLSDKKNAGKSYVIFGKQDNTAINLSAIAAGTGGFVINGESKHDYSGWSVSSAGDVNGDGLDDLIIGALYADSNGKVDTGKSYIVFGKQDNTAINLSAIAAGTGGFVINGESRLNYSGSSVSSAGDVNGDGLDDLIVGAFQADPSGQSHAGKSYVVFGKKDNTDAIELSAIAAGTGGFVINGESARDFSGHSVSNAGDVNGDGLDDLIVGAYLADSNHQSQAGKSYVVFGKKDNTHAVKLSDIAAGIDGFVIIGESAGDYSGHSVSSAGDVNGDGLDDLIVGANGAKSSTGKSYVIFGKTDTGAIDLSKLGDEPKYTIDYLGDENANILTGTTKDEIFVAGAGNDILTGNGGMDVFNAGLGDDMIIINASNIAALEKTGAGNRARVDGGGGMDALKLEGAGLTLDLTKISDRRIQDIEVIDITGSGNNTLKLNLNDLLHASTSTNILKVLGNSGDKVMVIGFDDSTTEKTVYDITYTIYAHSNANTGANAELWVQKGVTLMGAQRGFVINGESANDDSGRSVSNAGDVNGDGLDDLIIGAWGANLSGKSNAGKSYVVFGKQDTDAVELSAIAAGKGGFVINGESIEDGSGYLVSNAGDVNGDGLDDLIVANYGGDPSKVHAVTGKSYVVFGKQGTDAIELSAIAAGKGGFIIKGESASFWSDHLASNAGDINGDGLDDLIISARETSDTSYVVFGKQDTDAVELSAIASGTGGFVIVGELTNDEYSHSISNAGDVNGDGLDDLIVGNEESNINGKLNAGKSYVVFGKKDNTNAIELSDIVAGKGGFVINGESEDDYSSFSISSAGDVNGDGLDDLIVGAYSADPSGKRSAGKSYVVFGKKDNTNAIELSAITTGTSTDGFVINGESAGDWSGYSVSSAGDVNGDGLDDLIVGAYRADPSGKSSAGKSYVVFGKKDNTNAIELSDIAAGIGGFVIIGESAGDYSGHSVSSAGDVNGDGLDDLIVGANGAKSSAGKSYVIFGKTDTNAIDLSKLGDKSKYTIDYLGDKNANILTGTTKDEIFVAGAGNDILTGNGGMDVFNAGLGNDNIIINASNITALEKTGTGNRTRVDGGGGIDTLKLEGAGLTLDLTKISDRRIQDIEVIDITGSGNNTLQLNLDDLLHASTSTNILKVLGNSGDEVIVTGFNGLVTKKTVNGVTYDVYTHSDANAGANAELWVQKGVTLMGAQRGFVIKGESARDHSGYSVSNAGDVNGDGLDDLIIGAYGADPSGKSSAGKSYIVFGKQDTDAINLSDIVAGKGGFVINGKSVRNYSGRSVSSAGDVNGDGLDDLIIGAYSTNPNDKSNAGESYVVFGKQDTDAINLSSIIGAGGFVIKGEPGSFWSSHLVSSAGDVNGDGLDDLIISARDIGKSYVLFGKQDTNAINLPAIAAGTSTDGFVIKGEPWNDYRGHLISSAGDINGDGLDDLIIGVYEANPNDKSKAGKSYVVFGKKDNTGAIELSDIVAGKGGFVINGESVRDYSGYSVSSAGDVNGDGLDDLIIGARQADPSGQSHAGKSYVVFGKKDNTDAIELSAIAAGAGGFVINGESARDYSGCSVSNAGDVNGDGLDDLIVGAYGSDDSSGKSHQGKSYVVFGKKDNTNAIELSDIAAGIGGFVIIGESAGDYSGHSVSSAGDVNGDGLDDLIVGAWNADPSGRTSAGKSYVIFGKTDTNAIDLSKLGDKSKYTIDYLGDKNDNILTGTTKDEIFVAGAGNDTLTGNGGMDVLNAGTGDDTIIINASNIAALEKTGAGNRARVDGGGGIDTLKLEGAGLTLDLTKISDRRIQDIEVIDITGSGNNTLKLNLDDLLHTSTSTNILKVLGNSGDKVIVIDFDYLTTEKTVNGVTYSVYTHSNASTGANAEIWVQKDVILTVAQRGFVINGESTHDHSGRSVSSAGDVNGDGLDDLIVGAYTANPGGKPKAGKSYVVFGKQGADPIELSAIATGTGGFVINGESAGDFSGHSVSSAGDVNGDGLDDLIVGTKEAKSYVVFGKQDTAAIELSAIATGTGGFVISGESMRNHSRFSVSSAGDVNGDGLDDLIIGAHNAGKSYVVFGKQDTAAINLSVIAAGKNTVGFVIKGESRHDYSGFSVSSAGDVNGDGLDDLIIGAHHANPSGEKKAGKSYVVFGKQDTYPIELSAIATGKGGFVIKGESAGDHSGYVVSSAGDVNGDGLDDLIVGAYGAKSGAGKSYVIFGKQDNTAINLSAIAAGTGGFVINGESAGDRNGYSVSSAGDVNGDGLGDLIVGAHAADPSGKSRTGKSYVVFGKKDNTNTIELSDIATGIGGFIIIGESVGDHSGRVVSSAGDVNGDGLDDLIVGADSTDQSGKTNTGKSYVIFGKTNTNAIDLSKLGDESKYTIDYLGDKNDNILTGTTKDEIFVAGAGNDILTGNGGMDVLNAGTGDDTIIINASNIAALEKTGSGNRARVDGGGGIDTLKLEGAGLTLDLTKISDRRIQDIEVIDITGSGNNTLQLNLDDLLHASTSTNILKVLGNSGDKVNAAGFSDSTIDKTVDGITYDVYTHGDANIGDNVALWVQQEVVMF